ncbi:Cif family virulence factor [Kordiimonas aestuarii]|uniref:hypothetical protein n=1 Tax=Kordiimonas aestuarii TaxID=1005925 RepID=UPI0021D18674|nr:hypothetical protein [Kordiimonas aestuarii]
MKRFSLIFTALLAFLLPSYVWAKDDSPAYIGRYAENAKDKSAINVVIEKFSKAIEEKDAVLLQSLFMHDDILFISPPTQDVIDTVRKDNPSFMKSHPSKQAEIFANYISTSEATNKERFFNVNIVQDGNFALVYFDYDFLADGKAINHGIEVWNMFRIDDEWRIASVTWSTNMMTN